MAAPFASVRHVGKSDFEVMRRVTAFLAAVGYAIEQLVKLLEVGREATLAPQMHVHDPNEAIEPDASYFDDDDLRFLCETFERVNQRFLDEIRGFDGLSGALLVAIFAVFVLLLDKAEAFTWWPMAALIVPTVIIASNFGGRLSFSPDPVRFQQAFDADATDAVLNLVESHKSDITKNAALRNHKRKMFNRSLGIFILISLAAAGFKGYNAGSDNKEVVNEKTETVASASGSRQGLQRRHPRDNYQGEQGVADAEAPDGLQLRLCRGTYWNARSGEDGYQTVGVLIGGPRGGLLPLYLSPSSDGLGMLPAPCRAAPPRI